VNAPGGRPDPLIFLVAGEPSGDALGAGLMAALKENTAGRIRFAGVGGNGMAGQGLESLFPMAELSVMGAAEVIPRLPAILGRIRETARKAAALAPAAVVTIDSPDFSFRVGRRLAGRGIPLIHYVAPTVWAWRAGRAKRIARFLDHLLALLPFEPPYFEREGLPCTFVGHPVVESGADRGDGPAFRRRHGIAEGAPLLAVLPGSRAGEVERLLPAFGSATARLARERAGLGAVVATVPAVAEAVRSAVRRWPFSAAVVEEEREKYDAFAAADAALAASGTVALELAMAGTPAVIGYRMNPLTSWLAMRLVRVRFASIVNLVLEREAVPEFLLHRCTPDNLAEAVGRLLDDHAARDAQRAAAGEALRRLGRGGPGPSERAARVVLETIRRYASR
jgi:lipid-A-disaccharide synthase